VAFEIQELPDVIRVVVLLYLRRGTSIRKIALKRRIDRVCSSLACVDMPELEKALKEMTSEGLLIDSGESVQLTDQGQKLGKEWQSLLLKKEPILEVVAGLVDGSITSLVVIISAFVSTLTNSTLFASARGVIFTAFLTLTAVAVTNFSSFFLGGITEDMADIITLRNLMNYSLSDIPDKNERDKSLMLVEKLFLVLDKEIRRSNLLAAVVSGVTTFIAGSIPIVSYLVLPFPFNIILSLAEVATISGIFLVRYRSRKTRRHWRVTLIETLSIVALATLASLLLGGLA
jgi:DNA-binding PadR family transcriptional regulator